MVSFLSISIPVVVILLSTSSNGNDIFEFTIKPETQYVWINQPATFDCATNISGYVLSFNLGILIDNQDVYDLPGGGKKATTSFVVALDNNGTTGVRCIAQPDGAQLPNITHPPVYAYAQSSPSSVVDLTAVQEDQCSISIQWNPPYLLPGLSVSYDVYINGDLIQDDISTTDYTYYPMRLTNTTYNVTVLAFNDSVIGDATDIDVVYQINDTDLELLEIEYLKQMLKRQDNTTWTAHFKLSPQSCNIVPTSVDMLDCNNGYCTVVSTGPANITSDDDGFIRVIANLSLHQNMLYSVLSNITYEEGGQIMTSGVEISTHDIQNVYVINSTNSKLCIQFDLVRGWIIEAVYVHLVSDKNNITRSTYFSDHDVVLNKLHKCFAYIPASTWSVYICEHSSEIICDDPAVPAVEVIIIGANSSPSINVSSPTFTSSSLMIGPSTTNTSGTEPGIIVAAVVGTVVVGTAIIIAIILILIIIIIRKKKHCSGNFSPTNTGSDTRSTSLEQMESNKEYTAQGQKQSYEETTV